MLGEVNITLTSTLYSMIASFVSAFVMRKVYILYGRSMNNREYFGNIFILLALTTCAVIVIVKYSLALSLGLVGALSIVRFRAAIKEPEELVYLFLVIALGLCFGANQFAVGAILLLVTTLSIYVTSKFYTKTYGLENSSMLIVISGERKQVEQLKNEGLALLFQKSRTALLREVDFTQNNGRLVIKATSLENENFITSIENEVQNRGLNLNIINDISVAQ